MSILAEAQVQEMRERNEGITDLAALLDSHEALRAALDEADHCLRICMGEVKSCIDGANQYQGKGRTIRKLYGHLAAGLEKSSAAIRPA